MKRDNFVPFVLGFLVGALFMLLACGSIGGVMVYTMHQRVLAERKRAAAAEEEVWYQREIAEEQAMEARRQEEEARQRAEDALRAAEKLREKP